MKSFPLGNLSFWLSFLCFLFALTAAVSAQDKDWRPVTPQELAAKTPVVEPDADAEAIFWEVRVDDSSVDGLVMKHYVRVKIFTERGRERFSKHDIPFEKGTRVKDVEARVTKPDGSAVYLNKEDVLERDIVKANGFKIKAKSFALPGLEVGSIVEYRYREVLENASANMRLIFQRDIPIQTVSYYVKPFSGDRGMYYEKFHVGDTKFEKDKDGFSRATMTNVPAIHEEPDMLPENEIRSWMYIYYAADRPKDIQEYWKGISKAIYEGSKSSLKVNDDVKDVTNEVIGGATTDEDKLRKIYDYTKTQIKNISYASGITDEDKKKVKNIKTPSDTLKLKMGSPGDIDSLFGAMAKAAGFDARIAVSGNRDELFFDPHVANFSLMLSSSSIAVKIGNDWRFFSPASYYVPFGMMSWVEEGQAAMITDPKELIWSVIPLSPAEKTLAKRSGKFKLLEDGTLEGEAKIEYYGHWAVYEKRINHGDSAAEQEKTLKNLIKENILGTVEVESFNIENVDDPDKPFVYTFKIRVPGYASKTGKRLFFQPNVFERSSHPRFTASNRKYDVYFTYPFSENDDLTIEFPDGFALENADAPAPVKDSQGISSHQCSLRVRDKKTLLYKRTFSFGSDGLIRFPAASYLAVKGLFEAFNKADVHQLTLKQEAATASVPAN
jgi:hypothetical protein